MSNQKVSNERKKELEQLDPFQENMIKVINSVKVYQKQLWLIFGAVALIVVVFSGIMYSFKRSENTASTLLSQAMTSYSKVEDPQKGYDDLKGEFETILSDYANTAAGKLARIEYAKICYDAGRFEESFTHYKQALDQFEDKAAMENFLLAALGHVSIAKNDEAAARKYFKRIEKSNTNLLKDEALFALAMLDEKKGNAEGSRALFEKITTDHETSIYFKLAKSKLAQ